MDKFVQLIGTLETLLSAARDEYEARKKDLDSKTASLQALSQKESELKQLEADLNAQKLLIEQEKTADAERKAVLEKKDQELQQRILQINNMLKA